MKTHIPDHATGHTYCGREIKAMAPEMSGKKHWAPPCIDLARDCIEDATCRACQRADDRRQADEYRRERAAALFEAACRWAQARGLEMLRYCPRRQGVGRSTPVAPDGSYRVCWRLVKRLDHAGAI